MTNEEIVDGDELILKFMQYRFLAHVPSYSKDWNALIGAVEKIESMGFKTIIGGGDMWGNYMNIITGVGIIRETIDNPSKFMGKGETKIEAVYSAVIQFIKWHTKNKSEQ